VPATTFRRSLNQHVVLLTGKIDARAAEIRVQKQPVAELNDLKHEIRAARLKLQHKDQPFAQR
jgi:hypothetical protein